MTKLQLLWGMGILWAQPMLPLRKLLWYSSGKAYWVREATLPMLRPFLQVRIPQTASMPFPLPQSDYRIQKWTVTQDTLLLAPYHSPTDLLSFLRQHIGANAWLLYEAGKEWEETHGTIEGAIAAKAILLRKPNQERVWLPVEYLRAARVEGSLPRELRPAWRLSIETDTTLPSAPVAVAGWDTLPPWQAYHLIQLIAPNRLLLQSTLHLPPLNESASSVEVYLLQEGSDSGYVQSWYLPLQQIQAGTTTHLTLLQAELPFTDVYRASLPDLLESTDPLTLGSWKGTAERSLQILNTQSMPLPPGKVRVLDEQGMPLAESYLHLTLPTTAGYVPLAATPTLQLRLQENEQRREKPKDPEKGTTRVLITGLLRIQNTAPREIRLIVEKSITGMPVPEKLGFARSSLLPERRGANPRYGLTWELVLRPGSTETIEYAYEVALPSLR
ncbi:MAG: DUF4139 domain-containing protein [Bacteroidia bacterium]|nr:DUF4139 domain-containing protein [Bacteroidia bacterium]MDW8235747.1 hypothetical protein [Bacteroidia bacterium]